MKLTADQIDSKAIAGKTTDGRAVVYVSTKGGLHAFFCKDEAGNTCSIGAAPHRAIAQFLAGKKENITWESDFKKAETNLAKSEEAFFQKLRKVMFCPPVMLGAVDPSLSESFALYDVAKQTIEVVSKAELEDDIKHGKVDRFALVRDLSLSMRSTCIQDHPEFASLFEVTHG
jgi:hypothetical protein